MKKLPKSAPISLGHWGTTPGLKRLFTQFSFPGGIPSHMAAKTPGSINEKKYNAALENK